MGMRDSNWFLIGIESSGDGAALGWGWASPKHLECSRNQKITTIPDKCVLDKTKEEKTEFLSGMSLGSRPWVRDRDQVPLDRFIGEDILSFVLTPG